MTIAVNTRFLRDDYLEGYGYFVFETFRRIVKDHSGHQFIFIFERAFDQKFVFAENVKAVVAGPPARHPLLWKYWYDVKVPAILKKYKAAVFVSCDGFCSLSTSVPQCLVIHDLSFLHYPSSIPKSHWLFYKRYTPKFLHKAKSIVTVSGFSKKDIASQYKIDEAVIDVVPNAAREVFHPLADADKAAFKDELTNGKEYFVYAGAIHPRKNLVNLLKAFSIFKKKQMSNWKLVLTGRLAWQNKDFIKSLETFKYRADVILTGYVDEPKLVKIIASAY